MKLHRACIATVLAVSLTLPIAIAAAASTPAAQHDAGSNTWEMLDAFTAEAALNAAGDSSAGDSSQREAAVKRKAYLVAQFLIAVAREDVGAVQSALAVDASYAWHPMPPAAVGWSGLTPLHVAAFAGSVDMVRLLDDAGGDVDAVDDRQRSVVRLGILGYARAGAFEGRGHEDARLPAALDTVIPKAGGMLDRAGAHAAVLQYLLGDGGAAPVGRDLLLACDVLFLPGVRALVHHGGGDVVKAVRRADGRTTLIAAVHRMQGWREDVTRMLMLPSLVSQGIVAKTFAFIGFRVPGTVQAEITRLGGLTRRDAQRIVSPHVQDVLRVLLEPLQHDAAARAALVNARTTRGNMTALLMAAHLCDAGVTEVLMMHGADAFAVDSDGLTPLHAALLGCDVDVPMRILDSNTSLIARKLAVTDAWGRTPLHIALLHGNVAAAEMFVGAGASRLVVDVQGRRALDVVPPHLRDAVRQMLRHATADQQVWHSHAGHRLQPLRRVLGTRTPDPRWSRRLQAQGQLLPSVDQHDVYHCDIDVVEASEVSPEDVIRDYLSIAKPVLLRGAAAHWPAMEGWTLEGLATAAAEVNASFSVGAIPYAQSFGLDAHVTTLADFIRDHMPTQPPAREDNHGAGGEAAPMYLFEPVVLERALPSLAGSVDDTRFFHSHRIMPDLHQLIVGPQGSGSPLHFHLDAWNGLVFGRKRWELVAPTAARYSSKHPRAWLMEDHGVAMQDNAFLAEQAARGNGAVAQALVPDARPLSCVQEAGDVMYVPRGWGHLVLNTKPSAGVAVEFLSPQSAATYSAGRRRPRPPPLEASAA